MPSITAATTALIVNLWIVFIGLPFSQTTFTTILIYLTVRRFGYLVSLVPEISMDTCRSGCMQATFFALLASLHSAAAVLGRVSPHALVLTRSADTPLL